MDIQQFIILCLIKSVTLKFFKEVDAITYQTEDIIYEEDAPSKIACMQKALYFKAAPVYDGTTCKCIKKKQLKNGNVDGQSGSTFKMIPIDEKVCREEERKGFDLPGYDLRHIMMDSKEECISKCKQLKDCHVWVWDSNWCLMKFFNTGTYTSRSGHILGTICKPTKCTEMETIGDKLRNVHDVVGVLSTNSKEECIAACRKNVSCLYWQFLSGDGCLLLRNDFARKKSNMMYSTGKICRA